MLQGGTYQWNLPKVDLGAAGSAPTIIVPAAPDPVTGSAILPLRRGGGAPFTDLSRLRLHYVRQSWSGQVLHNSWRFPAYPEAVPTGRLGDKIHDAVLLAHQGDVIEVVVPSDTTSNGQSEVIVLSLDAV